MPQAIPIISIVGKQNVGKTTLIGLIIKQLRKKGYKVGTIKYNIPYFKIDYKGKDTHRHYQAGADVVSISSPEKLAIIKRINKKRPPIDDIVRYNYQDVDIVIVEGYKSRRYPYIEIHKNKKKQSQTKEYKNHIKITGNNNINSSVPVFQRADINNALNFIESRIKKWLEVIIV